MVLPPPSDVTNHTEERSSPLPPALAAPRPQSTATGLQHVVFGIAASAKLWEKRKVYIKISGDISRFPYTHRKGDRSAIRISRIVSETFRLGFPNVRWFVMGDDDTVFLPDNLARLLSRFDHRQPYYIGSLSDRVPSPENIFFSYNMAYGGGGFAISTSIAASLTKVQDRCLRPSVATQLSTAEYFAIFRVLLKR